MLDKSKTKVPKKIIDLLKALKHISKDNSLYISRLDKGNAIAILNKTDYISKMDTILQDEKKFKTVINKKRDIFIAKENQINRLLLKLKNEGQLTDEMYKRMRTTGSQPCRLYGLPKIHKNKDNPLYGQFSPLLTVTVTILANDS